MSLTPRTDRGRLYRGSHAGRSAPARLCVTAQQETAGVRALTRVAIEPAGNRTPDLQHGKEAAADRQVRPRAGRCLHGATPDFQSGMRGSTPPPRSKNSRHTVKQAILISALLALAAGLLLAYHLLDLWAGAQATANREFRAFVARACIPEKPTHLAIASRRQDGRLSCEIHENTGYGRAPYQLREETHYEQHH